MTTVFEKKKEDGHVCQVQLWQNSARDNLWQNSARDNEVEGLNAGLPLDLLKGEKEVNRTNVSY